MKGKDKEIEIIRKRLRARCRARCGENKYCDTCDIYKAAKLIGPEIQPSDCVEYVAIQMIYEAERKR